MEVASFSQHKFSSASVRHLGLNLNSHTTDAYSAILLPLKQWDSKSTDSMKSKHAVTSQKWLHISKTSSHCWHGEITQGMGLHHRWSSSDVINFLLSSFDYSVCVIFSVLVGRFSGRSGWFHNSHRWHCIVSWTWTKSSTYTNGSLLYRHFFATWLCQC